MVGRDSFDEARQEIWNELARHLGAGEWDGAPLRVRHGGFAVTLDVHAELAGKATVVETRLRAAYANPRGFRFRLRRQGFFEGLAAMLGAQDIEVGDPDFDRHFRVESNRPDDLRRVFADAALRRALVESAAEMVQVRDDEGWFGAEFADGVDELCLAASDRITDPAAVERLYTVFAVLLNELCVLRLADGTSSAPAL